MSEASFIESIQKLIPENYIGDDCAIIPMRNFLKNDKLSSENELYLLVTTDTLNEKIHFSLDYFSFYDIGFKSLAVNLSDIAACGGIPLFFSVGISVPSYVSEKNLLEIYNGFKPLLEKYKCILSGGDTVKGDYLSISITIIGKTNKPLQRAGAKSGDNIYVTGEIGCSSYMLKLFQKKIHSSDNLLIKKHLNPEPRINEILTIKNNFKIHSCTDISDGLSTSLFHLSGKDLGCDINFNQIPVIPSMSSIENEELIKHILNGGEDYELLFTSPDDIPAFFEGIRIYKIGKINKSGKSILVLPSQSREIKPGGWDNL